MSQKGVTTIQSDRSQLMSEGTRWLLEMEVLNIDHMKNALVLNIYKVSDSIEECELLIDENAKKMLVYLKLRGFGRMFRKREISQAVLNILQEALPSFEFRVTLDAVLFQKAVNGLRAHIEAREAKITEFRKKLVELKKTREATEAEALKLAKEEVERAANSQGTGEK